MGLMSPTRTNDDTAGDGRNERNRGREGARKMQRACAPLTLACCLPPGPCTRPKRQGAQCARRPPPAARQRCPPTMPANDAAAAEGRVAAVPHGAPAWRRCSPWRARWRPAACSQRVLPLLVLVPVPVPVPVLLLLLLLLLLYRYQHRHSESHLISSNIAAQATPRFAPNQTLPTAAPCTSVPSCAMRRRRARLSSFAMREPPSPSLGTRIPATTRVLMCCLPATWCRHGYRFGVATRTAPVRVPGTYYTHYRCSVPTAGASRLYTHQLVSVMPRPPALGP